VTAVPEPEQSGVRGERAKALVNAARSVQSRISSALAAALMIALGVSALTWYYAHAWTRQTRARAGAQSAALGRAQGDAPLPPLPAIVPPVTSPPQPPAAGPEEHSPVPAEELLTSSVSTTGPRTADGATPAAQSKSPGELTAERRLAGAVFARAGDAAPAEPAARAALPAGAGESVTPEPGAHAAELADRLRADPSPAVAARTLPSMRLLLPKGAFIDCTLETAIDSTLPGLTTCVTAADTFSADGKVVLLERGTKLVGETRGQVQQGQARVFVAWSEARTPTGVIVPLDSPGTDELGRAGLPGEVERHFWQRFGAAMLVSVVDGAVQAGVQATNRSGGTVIYTPSGSQEILTEVLKDTLEIRPTVVKRNGDRIQVLVARDVDFRTVYELHASGSR
jgi:type IV secretion system protein VirB10